MEEKNIAQKEGFTDLFADKKGKTLVLGIGNYLMGDEGVGVHIAHRLEKTKLPDYIDVLDGGTGGFFLMNVFDEYGRIILVDATMDGKPAGTISVIKPRFAADYPTALSVHDVGLRDMIEALYLQDNLPEIHLVTISVKGIQPMVVGMTPEIEKCVPEAVKTILELAEKIQSK